MRRAQTYLLIALVSGCGSQGCTGQITKPDPGPGEKPGAGGQGGSPGSGGSGSNTGGQGGSQGTGGSGGNPSSNGGAVLGKCAMFPTDNPWNQNITNEPVDPNSDKYMTAMNAASKKIHPDFGSDPTYGIPWITVPGSQPKVPVTFTYADESDSGPYPFPANAPVEGGANATGDRHVLVVDGDACKLYEGFACHPNGGGWQCDSGAIFDLRSNSLRPQGYTSADAAGLPVLPGLVRRDEILAGEIKHALRFTVLRTQRAYVAPATHYASSLTDPNLPPLGIRIRLKASFDISRYSGTAKVVLTALRNYGMFLADNGSDWYLSGEANAMWNDDEIDALKNVPATAFEVVKLGQIYK